MASETKTERLARLNAWLGELLLQAHRADKMKLKTLCSNCRAPLSAHFSDLRCSISVITTHYRAVNANELRHLQFLIDELEILIPFYAKSCID